MQYFVKNREILYVFLKASRYFFAKNKAEPFGSAYIFNSFLLTPAFEKEDH